MNTRNLVLGIVGASLLFANQALAHTTVKPATVGIGKFQTFTVAAPSEKPIATVGIRLVLPEGLNYVTPSVKAGWKIEVKKEKIGNEEKITEINWTGGTIPGEMRDEFSFSAQAPSKAGTLNWKAYQTYADGSVVAWDQDPNDSKNSHDFSTNGPFSKTEVIDDLSTPATTEKTEHTPGSDKKSVIAIVLSAIALATALMALKSKKQA